MNLKKIDKNVISNDATKAIGEKKQFFARVSITKDAMLVFGKVVLSLTTQSFFIFASALYNGSMGAARVVAIKMDREDARRELTDYRNVGKIIILASMCYIIYAIRLLFRNHQVRYHRLVAYIIIGYTVFEFIYLIWELWKLRNSSELDMKAVRFASLASTVLCCVLAQTALVSLSWQTAHPKSSAWTGIICGCIAAAIGLFVIYDSYCIQKRWEKK